MLGTARRPQVSTTTHRAHIVPKENTVPKKPKATMTAEPRICDPHIPACDPPCCGHKPARESTVTAMPNHLILDLADGKAPSILVNGVDIAPMADEQWSFTVYKAPGQPGRAQLNVSFSVVLP